MSASEKKHLQEELDSSKEENEEDKVEVIEKFFDETKDLKGIQLLREGNKLHVKISGSSQDLAQIIINAIKSAPDNSGVNLINAFGIAMRYLQQSANKKTKTKIIRNNKLIWK